MRSTKGIDHFEVIGSMHDDIVLDRTKHQFLVVVARDLQFPIMQK